jgi:hypothetical protein
MNEDLERFAPIGEKDCEGSCERDIVTTKTGVVIVCNKCDRIVMDKRESE